MHITEELLRQQAGLYTAKEIASIVGCPTRWLYYQIQMGRVTRPTTRIGRKPRRYFNIFELASVKQELAELRNGRDKTSTLAE